MVFTIEAHLGFINFFRLQRARGVVWHRWDLEGIHGVGMGSGAHALMLPQWFSAFPLVIAKK